jgi:tryptophan 2,3-dioxygenase
MIDPLVGAIVVIAVLLGLVLGAGTLKRRPKVLDATYFQNKWKEAQVYCKDKSTWPLAIINADKLLDEGLKRRRFKGKTMGERMVAAQREFTDNDGVWYAHKLRNRLVHEADVKLKESDVRKALVGIRQALKDLGAQIK